MVQPASMAAVTACAMLTAGIDSSNYYRIRERGDAGRAAADRGGQDDVSLLNDGVAHLFLIRHDGASGQVVWETAPGNGGVPGAWTLRHQAAWNTAAVPVTGASGEPDERASGDRSAAPEHDRIPLQRRALGCRRST